MVTENKIKSTTQKTNRAPRKKKNIVHILNQFEIDGLTMNSQYDMEKYIGYKILFNKYSFVKLSGKPVILQKIQEDGVIKYEYTSITDFKQFHVEEHFYTHNGFKKEKRYFADIWLENPKLRTRYHSTTFNPESVTCEDKEVFNYWTGFVEAKQGDVSVFLNHIDLLIDGTKEQKEHLIKLIAYQVRNPHIQTGTHLALRGKPGAGKTSVSLSVKAICPNHSRVEDDIENLFGFNAESLHVKFFLMEEAVWGGNKSSEGKLKNLLTADSRNISIKNLTGITIKNYGFYIFTSNEDWMVPVGLGDRRFNVFDCTSTLIDNTEYFDTYYEWLNGDGKHALMNYFLHEIDLSDFNPRKTINTKAKTELKATSLKGTEKFIFDIINNDIDCDLLPGRWEENHKVKRSMLYEYFDKSNKFGKISQGEFSRKLAQIFQFTDNWKDNWKNQELGGFYKFPSKRRCMELLAIYMKENVEDLFSSYSNKIKDEPNEIIPQEIKDMPLKKMTKDLPEQDHQEVKLHTLPGAAINPLKQPVAPQTQVPLESVRNPFGESKKAIKEVPKSPMKFGLTRK